MRLDILLSHPWFHAGLAALVAIVAACVVHRIARAVLSRVTRPVIALCRGMRIEGKRDAAPLAAAVPAAL